MAAVGAPNRSLVLSSPSGPTDADILKHAPIRARGRWPRRLPPLTPPLVLDRRLTTSAAATARNLCNTRGARQVRSVEAGSTGPGLRARLERRSPPSCQQQKIAETSRFREMRGTATKCDLQPRRDSGQLLSGSSASLAVKYCSGSLGARRPPYQESSTVINRVAVNELPSFTRVYPRPAWPFSVEA